MEDCTTFMTNFQNSGKEMPWCLEQPFINYIFYKEKLVDTKYLQKFIILCREGIDPQMSDNYMMYHFNTPIGDANSKLVRMNKYLSFSQKISLNNIFLKNPTYTWENGNIQIKSDNTLMTSWGMGSYYWKDSNIIVAIFCGREHNIYFENSFTTFLSVRANDCDIVRGNLIS